MLDVSHWRPCAIDAQGCGYAKPDYYMRFHVDVHKDGLGSRAAILYLQSVTFGECFFDVLGAAAIVNGSI